MNDPPAREHQGERAVSHPLDRPQALKCHARERLLAAAATAGSLLDLLAAAGLELDDRPRSFVAAVERWCRGELTSARLGAATRELGRPSSPDLTWRSMQSCARGLATARSAVAKRVTWVTWAAPAFLLRHAAPVLVALGEGGEAARHRANAMFDAHLARLLRDGAAST